MSFLARKLQAWNPAPVPSNFLNDVKVHEKIFVLQRETSSTAPTTLESSLEEEEPEIETAPGDCNKKPFCSWIETFRCSGGGKAAAFSSKSSIEWFSSEGMGVVVSCGVSGTISTRLAGSVNCEITEYVPLTRRSGGFISSGCLSFMLFRCNYLFVPFVCFCYSKRLSVV